MTRVVFSVVLVLTGAATGLSNVGALSGTRTIPGQNSRYTGPIFDVHIHTSAPGAWSKRPNPVTRKLPPPSAEQHRIEVMEQLRRFNIVRAVLHGPAETLDAWIAADRSRFVAAPMLFEPPGAPLPSVDFLRTGIRAGRYQAIGEVIAQYSGVSLADDRLKPYWRLAEELSVPVAVHTGRSFAGITQDGYPGFRLRFGNPLLMEDALVEHPKLRAYIMHGGEPWRQDTLALMSMYPEVYMDIAAMNWLMPRPAFHAFLREMLAHGLGKRIMFGTDEMAWPDTIELAVESVNSAEFLTPEQKADIFYNNAVRFFGDQATTR